MKPVQVLLPLVIASLLAGCGSTSSEPKSAGIGTTPMAQAPAPVKPAPGFKEANSAAFSMHVPESWKVVDFAAADMATKLDAMAKTDPAIAGMLPQLKQMAAAGQFKMFAFDLKNTENNFTDNINVIVQETPNIKVALIKANEDELTKQTGSTAPAKATMVKGKNSDLGVIKWSDPKNKNLRFHTVLGTSAAHVFTFTFTCQAKHEAAFGAIVDQIIPTIELK